MAYYPGAGQKKPHNVIQGPIYPDIKRDPSGSTGRTGHLGFTWSRKHWNVDAGATLRDLEHNRQAYEHAVLAQSRAYNSQTRYGVSSHREAVNKNFRPPLVTVEDTEPLSRLRRFITVPRVNPGTADNESSLGFATQNQRPTGIPGHLTDRVKKGEWRPTFFCPVDGPLDNSVLPDLELTLPAHEARAGVNNPIQIDGEVKHVEDFAYTQPQGSVTAGTNVPLRMDGDQPLQHLVLDSKRPETWSHAGINTPIHIDGEQRQQLDLPYNRPQGTTTAGMNTPLTISSRDPREFQLEFNVKPDMQITTNPSAEWMDINAQEATPDQVSKVQYTLPQVSYTVPASTGYAHENHRSTADSIHRYYRQKLNGFGPYHTKGHIPRKGVEQRTVALRQGGVGKRTVL